jgi:MFS family permease
MATAALPLAAVAYEPLTDPHLPPADELPGPSLWRNRPFQRVWSAATVSIFGSLITRVALPFVAIVTLNADAIGVAMVRSMDLIAGLAVGLVAGAWVDRLRRRPVLVGADLGRALLLGLIPLAAIGGWLSLPLLLIVALLTAVLTTFFDAADRAYLPTIVPRRDLVRANGALAASSSVSEFLAFGSAGFLVQILTAPIAIFVDALSFVISAVLLGSIRVKEPPPPGKSEREPVIREIAAGLRLVTGHPILRATTLASMATAATWGVFSATWYLFAISELGLDAAAIGIVAAFGGLSSLFAALITERTTKRFGVGPVVVGGILIGILGFLFVPLAPAGAPLIAMAFLIGQQLVTDPAMTVYDITDTSLRQAIVHDRSLGRVTATVTVAVLLAQLIMTLAGGFIAVELGLRTALVVGPLVGLLGVLAVYFSPVRRLRTIDEARGAAAQS